MSEYRNPDRFRPGTAVLFTLVGVGLFVVDCAMNWTAVAEATALMLPFLCIVGGIVHWFLGGRRGGRR